TPEFTARTVPAALLSAHHLAPGVWGRLVVLEATVTYHLEETGDSRRVHSGQRQVIEPEVVHHVEPGPESRFLVEFHR
ncbi:MAG: DUF1971 domain-containing protein, partial [Microthrixaceae bacterium]